MIFERLARGLFLKAGYARLNRALTKRWPKGWPAAKEAARGSKTLLGVLLLYAPEILQETEGRVRDLGMDPAQVLSWTATGLIVMGGLHKFLKFFLAFEFSGDLEDVKDKPLQVRSQPVLKTEEEHEAFIEAYRRLRERGVPFKDAREQALKVTLATVRDE